MHNHEQGHTGITLRGFFSIFSFGALCFFSLFLLSQLWFYFLLCLIPLETLLLFNLHFKLLHLLRQWKHIYHLSKLLYDIVIFLYPRTYNSIIILTCIILKFISNVCAIIFHLPQGLGYSQSTALLRTYSVIEFVLL